MRVAPAIFLAAAACTPAASPPLTFGVTAQEHQAYFPIADGAKHALGVASYDGPINCNSCHAGGATFNEYLCLSCHSRDFTPPEEVHFLVPTFSLDDRICLGCHADGTTGTSVVAPPTDAGPDAPPVDAGPVFDHDGEAFPISAGALHGPDEGSAYMARVPSMGTESQCAACHADVTVLRCAECHAQDADPTLEAAHIDSNLDDSFREVIDCKACHSTAPVPAELKLDAHNARSCLPHFNAKCTECHVNYQAPPKEWAYDFAITTSPVECLPCHIGDPRELPEPCP